jgi:predicted metal-binding membrane protein
MSARRWLWRHPELSVLALSAVAWAELFAPVGHGLPVSMSMSGMSGSMHMAGMSGSMHMAGMSGSMHMAGMSGSMHMAGTMPSERHGASTDGWTLPMFVLMSIAMMLPSTTGAIRLTAARSLWRRRGRAIAEWIGAFVAVWLFAGVAILGARDLAIDGGVLRPGPMPLVVGLVLAAAWQLTPIKRLALNGCHRTRPLSPSGLRADRDCLLYGAMIGRECVVSCGPMMTVMTLCDQHQLILMVGMTAVVFVERFRHRTPRRASAAVLGLLAAVAL